MKFTLDTTLPATLNVTSADDAAGHRFAEAVFAAGGVVAIYGVNDFITVTRHPEELARMRALRGELADMLTRLDGCSDRRGGGRWYEREFVAKGGDRL